MAPGDPAATDTDGETAAKASARKAERAALAVRGVVWNTLSQAFQALLQFGAMIVLVRIIPPAEYGRAGAVVGVLTVVNAFQCGQFVAHSLQLPDGEEPDWAAHFAVAVRIQILLALVGNAVAGVAWLFTGYRPIAPLLHLASIGLLVEAPNRLGYSMLLRAMDFRRLRLLQGAGSLASIAVILGLGVRGAGAWAIVVGQNVVLSLPFAIDLLLVRRWRPRPGWWRVDLRAYRPAIRFGMQNVWTALVGGARTGVAATVLPGTLGYVALGLLGRAQGLCLATVGRVMSIVIESVYPLLPRYAAEPGYGRYAERFAQAVLWIVTPGLLFVAVEGPLVSRVLYGDKWIAADPLLAPAAIALLGTALAMIANSILLAAGRLRACMALDGVVAACTVPTVALTAWGGTLATYAWAVGLAGLAAGVVCLVVAASLFEAGWARRVALPLVVGGAAGLAAVLVVDGRIGWLPQLPRLLVLTAAFGVACLVALRGLFPSSLALILARLPGGPRVARALALDGT